MRGNWCVRVWWTYIRTECKDDWNEKMAKICFIFGKNNTDLIAKSCSYLWNFGYCWNETEPVFGFFFDHLPWIQNSILLSMMKIHSFCFSFRFRLRWHFSILFFIFCQLYVLNYNKKCSICDCIFKISDYLTFTIGYFVMRTVNFQRNSWFLFMYKCTKKKLIAKRKCL